jgi:hypothetical protein
MKYILTSETKTVNEKTLYRIKALLDFGKVKASDLGGWIEKESNLSQAGNAWVFGDAQMYDNAHVSGSAQVSGNANVFGDAQVFGNAYVADNARVFGSAYVSGNARVFDNAQVFGDAHVLGDAHVFGDAHVTKTPIQISGGKYNVVITDKHMSIGCEQHEFSIWETDGVSIFIRHGSTAEIAKEYLAHLLWFTKLER